MSRKYCTVGKCPVEWQTIEYRPNIHGNVIYIFCFLALLSGQLWFGMAKQDLGIHEPRCVLVFLESLSGTLVVIMLNVNPFLMNNFLV